MHVGARAASLERWRLVGFGRGTVVIEPHGALLTDGAVIGLELTTGHGGFFSPYRATVLP